MTTNIYVSDAWTPINYFNGSFDGQNNSIIFAQTVTSTSDNAGLFAKTGSGAEIKNLTVQGNFECNGTYVGGIVGDNYGTITNCTLQNSTVTRTSSDPGSTTGGLVGENEGKSVIQNCRVINSSVTAANGSAGGLVGLNKGAVKNSFAAVNLPVAASNWAGNGGTITNCYRLGTDTNDETVATADEFKNGAVAYKLAEGDKSTTPQWGQTIGSDDYPILGGGTVYCVEDYYHNHTGSCAVCDDPDKPTKNADGTYEIKSYSDLLWFANLVNGTLMQGMPAKPAANAVLMNAIDITVDTVDTVGKRWPGIGTSKAPYSGSFNGNGYTVSLTDPDATTLFGTTDQDAYLNAICVKGGYLTQTDSAVVTNCYRPEKAPLFQNKAAGSATNCYSLDKLVEQESSGAAFTNCYAGADSGNGIAVKENDAFTNGEVAYLLAQGDSKWGQEINKDTYPTYGGMAVYYNTANTPNYHNHPNDNCEACGHMPTTVTENGTVWYIIRTAGELKWFAKYVNESNRSANARLENNIILNQNVLNDKGEPNNGPYKQWTPIGSSGQYFAGTFDGNGKTISGLYFKDSTKNYVGLFGIVDSRGTVKNVTIVDSYVSGNSDVGGICGLNQGGKVTNSGNTGTVTGTGYVGGVCGESSSGAIVQNCYNTGTVSGTNNIGGVCGYNDKSTLEKSYNTGAVTGTKYYIGGVCGKNELGTAIVQDCYNTNLVTCKGDEVCYIGGVCGQNVSYVKRCYNIGAVSGNANSSLGAICGKIGDNSTTDDCYYLNTSGNDTTSSTSATAAEFKSGKVAYLLQRAVNQTSPDTWGQTIGTNESPVLVWQKDYKKVYPTGPNSPCKRYSNTENGNQEHEYVNGECIYCGDKKAQVAYTVTIPATVELGNTVTVKADGVTLPDDKQLNVTMSTESGRFEVAQGNDVCKYTVTKGEAKTPVNPNDTVLTVENGGTGNSVELTFIPP